MQIWGEMYTRRGVCMCEQHGAGDWRYGGAAVRQSSELSEQNYWIGPLSDWL